MTQTSTIRVMIVDDHDILRWGVTASLSTFSDIQVVGEASNGVEAVRRCSELEPDVVLVDMKMPGMDGPTLIQMLKHNHHDMQVIALTSFQERELVHAAISAGAISYLLKNIGAKELAEAVRRAFFGKATLATEATQALVDATRHNVASKDHLTRRERQVIALMVKGMTNAEIAQALTISYSTVKKHVSNILAKLETASRTEAVAIALQRNLLAER